MSEATALAKDLAEKCGQYLYTASDSFEWPEWPEQPETLRKMGRILELAKTLVELEIKGQLKRRAFKDALAAGDLQAMKAAHCMLGSPDLANFYVTRYSSAIDIFVEGFVSRADLAREHLAWLQGLGARYEKQEVGCHFALRDLIRDGLDMAGRDLTDVLVDAVHEDRWTEEWLTPFLFSRKVSAAAILAYLQTGATMWPLDQPGASADTPPTVVLRKYMHPRDASVELYYNHGPTKIESNEYHWLSLFWPDQYPRAGPYIDGNLKFPPVAEIRDSVTAVCTFFAVKRREEAWQRRRLVVLGATRSAPPGRQRHKAAELTGLGALVRNVTAHEELLLRAVVAYL